MIECCGVNGYCGRKAAPNIWQASGKA